MNAVANSDPSILRVRVTEDEIIADLADGRVISVPLSWSWCLSEGTPAHRANFRLIGTGQGVHWPMLTRTSASKACSAAALRPGREFRAGYGWQARASAAKPYDGLSSLKRSNWETQTSGNSFSRRRGWRRATR